MSVELYMRGTCKWAKVHDPVPGFDKTKMQWEICLYPDSDSWKSYDKSGLNLKVREDTDGKFIQLKRPTAKLIRGEVKQFTPPKVFSEDGLTPLTAKIGNGSTVVVKVDVYNTMRGKGHQLEAVKVEELIPYDNKEVVATDTIVPF